ncbi:hypothetical protein Pan241w_08910 [Gimesia alba]|uniref:Leucine Rich repeats (2 copies) n=1 Tax=Gimesia alba TaxID=2527973 RepID=A0A517RAB2_9PLAN|nr:hypothetical protein [Gimesia alba]QDT40832.1 hypothetical protein Pan241w_08910 [Gimesia alba]
MQMRRQFIGPGFLIAVSMLLLCTNCSEQRPAPVDMGWCLSDHGDRISGGFELRNGRVIGVNLAEIRDDTDQSKLFALSDLEYLRLTNQAFRVIGAQSISKHFASLKDLNIRYEMNQEIENSTITFTEYQQLLTLPQLNKLTVELLQLTDERTAPSESSVSPVEHLDLALNLQSPLLPVLDGLHLKTLRLQLLRESRPLNAEDLKNINQQVDLESFTFFGPSLVSLSGPSDVQPAKIDFSRLKGLSRLQELSLCNVDFDPAGLTHLPQLKRLKIRECQLRESPFEVLFQHPTLEILIIQGCTNEDLGLKQPLSTVDSKLKQIDLEMVSLSELKMFANVNCDLYVTLGSMNSERCLERFFCSIGPSVPQLTELEYNQLSKLKKMSELKLVHNLPGRIDPAAILRFAAIPSLHSLVVKETNIEGAQGKFPRIQRNPRLQHLVLLTYPGPAPGVLNQLLHSELLSLSIRNNKYAERRPVNPWEGLEVVPLSQLQKLDLADFQFLRDASSIPEQFLPRSLKQISFEYCDLDADSLVHLIKRANQLELFHANSSDFVEDVDLRILNDCSDLKRIDLFNSQVPAEVAFQLKARHVRVGGAEMFSW